MQVVALSEELRQLVSEWRRQRCRIALVPTMGNLHEGHLALVRAAGEAADRTVVSVFVNPSQFGPNEDFARYPRTFERDCAKLKTVGTSLVFAPTDDALYPGGLECHSSITVPGLEDTLCGAFRPGHFAGVATVVAKLFNLVGPDEAWFGEKDYQQLLVVRRMAQDFCFSIAIKSIGIVRETDGLAMSSRNGYLTAAERQLAPMVFGQLQLAADTLRGTREQADYAAIEGIGAGNLRNAGFKPDYFVIRRAADLQLPGEDEEELIVLAAAWLGSTRLIDNVAVHNPH